MSVRIVEARTVLQRVVARQLAAEYRAHLADLAEAGDGCA